MNVTIQNKLTAYFCILIISMSVVTFYIYQSSERSIRQYDDILQRFLLLNEITQRNNQVHELFQSYLLVPTEDKRRQYEEYRADIQQLQGEFAQLEVADEVRPMHKNYYHMLSYFFNRMDLAMDTYTKHSWEHFQYREDVQKVASWLNETSLSFIHHELQSYHELHHGILMKNQHHLSLGLMAVIFFFNLSLLFTYVFCKRVTDPIRFLAKQAKELSKGRFDIEDAPENRQDEFAILNRTFNQMKRSIQKLILEMKQKAALETELKEQTIQNIEMNHLLKEMELRTLQNQMNPHFLFNTLNTLSKMAYIEGAEKSSDLIVSVSSLLRYCLKSLDQPVTLKDEINHVRDYFEIQRSRFGQRVTFDMNIDSNDLSHTVPLLTLQPLVENACIHGIDTLEEGAVIRVNVYDTQGHTLIDVYDNGVGIDEETLEETLSHLQNQQVQQNDLQSTNRKGHTTGIGLSNVFKRLSLFYQDHNVMDIHSKPGEGTRIRLKLPKQNTQLNEGVS
ncbi:sensor histidine kinase [Caldalkalibacillus salinus]|uniref:sensor histidine kinase n=1 Tax=Caldalkalibacillus salinus TaxID=2803787 RepID=UPI0019240E4D|nr:histidine kinase [Caldalkalibacillus salinus]